MVWLLGKIYIYLTPWMTKEWEIELSSRDYLKEEHGWEDHKESKCWYPGWEEGERLVKLYLGVAVACYITAMATVTSGWNDHFTSNQEIKIQGRNVQCIISKSGFSNENLYICTLYICIRYVQCTYKSFHCTLKCGMRPAFFWRKLVSYHIWRNSSYGSALEVEKGCI